ncbi:MAG: hypothetical protein HQL61_13050 [Magnetococcales bacterium]|nr:hypothetical protein [Nitrospirota bacterium]
MRQIFSFPNNKHTHSNRYQSRLPDCFDAVTTVARGLMPGAKIFSVTYPWFGR